MALTLDANLAAAQDSQSKRPIVEIMSLQNGADIPFDGTLLTTATFLEYSPAILAHSTGRLIIAYSYQDGGTYGIKFVYTDTARQTFSFYTFVESAGFTHSGPRGISLVELADGSVGMVYLLDEGTSKYHLIRRVIPVTGGAGTRVQVAEWDQLNQRTSDPWVVKLGSASYAIYYVRKVAVDGHYHFWKRSSTDFATWGMETETGPASGTTLTQRHSNPSLLKVSGGDLFLFFDYLVSTGPNGEELTNCYYAKSTDDGASWSAAAAFTNYSTYGQTGEHPVALQKTATSLHVLFTLKASALQMDHTTTGWVPEGSSAAAPVDLMFDPAGRKLWVTMSNTYVMRGLNGVVQIDVDTWTVDKYWSTTTVPAFDEHFDDVLYNSLRSEYPYVVVANCAGTTKALDVLNVADDTITHYYFNTVPAHGITANVTGSPAATDNPGNAVVVASENRIYMIWSHEAALQSYFQVGYIDLTETSSYQWHSVVPVQVNKISALIAISPQSMFLSVWPEEDMLCVSGTALSWGGGSLILYSLSTGAEIKNYNMATHPDFPFGGALHTCLYGGRIWAGFPYWANDGQEDFRGLMEVDYISDVFTFHRPTHVSVDEYYIKDVSVGATGKLLVCMESTYGGVAVFDIGADTWDVFSSTTVPGLTPTNENTFHRAIYDSAASQIFAAHGWTVTNSFRGIVAFSEYGAYKQSQYCIGTLSGGSWTFADPGPLVGGYHDHEAVGVPDPGDASSMFVFWRNENVTGVERSIKWDKDASSLDVSPYLVAGTEITASRSIDGRPGSLSFTASHGHLFDPYNKGSLFSIYLRKGRRLTLRWGEEIAGVNYWQNAGTFYVTAARLNFERGNYPIVEVEAEDRRVLWANCHIYATAAYENLPVEILKLLMEGYAGFTAAEEDFPASLDNQVTIQHQWIDTTLDEIVNQLCNRFGYYFRLTADNKASCRKISESNAVDHAYADLAQVIRFSPDDTYSDFTNRVTVQGQERSFIDVLYAEERVGALSGTVGWWGFKNDFPVYYSDDKERTCKNPRLVTLEKATSIGFKLSGSITEGITYEDPYDKYCTVTISAPNLVPLLSLLLVAEFGAMLWDPDPVQVGPSGSGFTIPVAEGIRNTILLLILMILSSTGNYQYEIWAQPTGKIRRSVQSTANDTVHQAEIALVVEKKIEDPLCYSVPDCAVVAAFELMVARLQRNRVTVEKVAHIQDEEGDTITLPHPYSGQTVKLFVTDLIRSLVIGEIGRDNGAFTDQISGWVLN